MPTIRPPIVSESVQPRSGPSWMPRTRPPMASADSTEPMVSKRPVLCSRELPTDGIVISSEIPANSTGIANSHGHVKLSIRNDETNRPRMPPAPAKPDQMPTARARCSAGKLDVITDSVTGMIIAAATPARTRAMSSMSTLVENPASGVGGHEQDEAGEQDRLAAPAVADRTDRQQQRGEGHRVAVDDPQQLALRGAEVEGEVLLGDVEARHGGDDGDERRAHGDEDPALPPRVGDDLADLARRCRRLDGGCWCVHVVLRSQSGHLVFSTRRYRTVS